MPNSFADMLFILHIVEVSLNDNFKPNVAYISFADSPIAVHEPWGAVSSFGPVFKQFLTIGQKLTEKGVIPMPNG